MLSEFYITITNKLLNPNPIKVSLNCPFCYLFPTPIRTSIQHLRCNSYILIKDNYFSLYKILIFLKQLFYYLMCLKCLYFLLDIWPTSYSIVINFTFSFFMFRLYSAFVFGALFDYKFDYEKVAHFLNVFIIIQIV